MSALPSDSMRLPIVEDDLGVRQLVMNNLEERGVTVTPVGTVADALAELHHTAFDVAILDLNLPDGTGFSLLRELREPGCATHVIILSAVAGENDRVRLELGADDYVVKPFFVRELTARVLAVRRRQDLANNRRLRYGPITIDLAVRQASIDDEPLSLTTKEFELLAFLAARSRQAFSRDDLLRAVWRSAADWQQPSTVTEHVRRLRCKIEQDPHHPLLLRTVRGVGYRFDPPMSVPATP